jgi:hypothetical protein
MKSQRKKRTKSIVNAIYGDNSRFNYNIAELQGNTDPIPDPTFENTRLVKTDKFQRFGKWLNKSAFRIITYFLLNSVFTFLIIYLPQYFFSIGPALLITAFLSVILILLTYRISRPVD